jgi:hypothetical protein
MVLALATIALVKIYLLFENAFNTLKKKSFNTNLFNEYKLFVL